CHVGDDGRIVYRLAHAERVELVVPSEPGADGRALPRVQLLERTAPGVFTGPAPGRAADARLLLTLSSGRVTWDEVRHD
ncbi:glycosyl transferase, partial [Streptomyces sp. SID10115]